MEKLDKKNIEDILALTPMQEGMLFFYLKAPTSDYYFEQLSLEISGEINVEVFEKAWNFVIETNEMLRTIFRWENVENPVQIILKEHKLQPGYYDFTGNSVNEKKKKLEEVKANDKKQKFDLREVPFRVTLCKTSEDKHEVIISNHHILYDGWSNGILLKEFFSAYNDLLVGKELIKPAKTKFKEFIRWSRADHVEQQQEFWKGYLKEFSPAANTPIKPGRKEVLHTGDYQFCFAARIKDKIEGFVKKK